MLKIIFSKKSLENLKEIKNFISSNNPVYSKRVLDNIYDTIKLLEKYPYIGPKIKGKYRKLVSKYKYTII